MSKSMLACGKDNEIQRLKQKVETMQQTLAVQEQLMCDNAVGGQRNELTCKLPDDLVR